MSIQTIGVGSSANDGTGDPARTAFLKVNANFAELYGIYGSEVEAFTFTTKQNDLALAAGTRILRWNGAGTTGITGIAAPSTARVVTIVNASTDYLLWLENENTASSAANRLMLPDAFPAFLMPGDTITLLYDLTTARWRVLSWPTRGQAMGLTAFNDAANLFGANTTATGTGASATALSASNWTQAKGHGLMACVTGTSGTGRAFAGTTSVSNFIPGHGPALFLCRCYAASGAPTGTDTFAGIVGFSDGYDGAIDNGMFWEQRWNGSAAEWSITVVSASSYTRTTAGAPSPNASRADTFGVFLNADASRADFIYSTDQVSHVLAQSVSSGLPAISTSGILSAAYGAIHSAGANSRGLYADWFGSRFCGVRA